MKLIKVTKKDADDPALKDFVNKAFAQSVRNTSAANGFCGYEFRASKWNDKNFVEINLSMPSSSDDGSDERDSVDTAIRVTENRLKTLKEAKAKLKKLQDEAKKLGFTIDK